MYKQICFLASLVFLSLPLRSQDVEGALDSSGIYEAQPGPRIPEIRQSRGVVVPADIPQNPFEAPNDSPDSQEKIVPQLPLLPKQQPQQQLRPAVRAASPFRPNIEEALSAPESESPKDFSANISEAQNAEENFGTENFANLAIPSVDQVPINNNRANKLGTVLPANMPAEAVQEGMENVQNAAKPVETSESGQKPGLEAAKIIEEPQSASILKTSENLETLAEPQKLEQASELTLGQPKENPLRGDEKERINLSKTIALGDIFPLSLYGLIWTYIPSRSETPTKPEFERKLEDQSTSFLFDLKETGRYLLAFSRQIPSTGNLEYYNAEIIVEEPPIVSSAQNAALLTSPSRLAGGQSAGIPEKQMAGRVHSDVRSLLQNGELQAAYETLQNWPERERGDIYEVAAQYFLNADMNAQAIDMWQRNVSLDGDLHNKAVKGILNALIQSNDAEKLVEWLPQMVEQARTIRAEDFARVYQILSQSTALENRENMLNFYQTYLSLYPGKNSPEILYKMALFFEKPGSKQDLRRARQLYRDIQREYPVDEYEVKASERLNYLNRHFFLVR